MKKKVIFEYINRFSGTLYSLLFLMFFGLAFVGTQFNFDLSKTSQVNDLINLDSSYAPLEMLSVDSLLSAAPEVKTPETSSNLPPVSTFISPSTIEGAAPSSDFTISDPAPSDCTSIGKFDTGVKVCNDQFFYAHSNYAFDWIKSASSGDTFTVSRNSGIETYKIMKKITLAMGRELNGFKSVESYYTSISKKQTFLGVHYSAALMTCGDGTFGVDGNNSSYRTFIFAERV